MTDNRAELLQADSLPGLLALRVAASPDVPFLINASDGQQLTFGEFSAQVERMAAWLQQQGVTAGSAVVWQLPTGLLANVVSFAIARLGATQAPVIHLYREREVSAIIQQSAPSHILIPATAGGFDYGTMMADVLAAIGADLAIQPKVMPVCGDEGAARSHAGAWERVAVMPVLEPEQTGETALPGAVATRWYYFTSGTTSAPKGAVHTDTSLMAGARHMAQRFAVTTRDIGSVGYPIAHVGGIIYVAMALMAGIPVVLIEKYIPELAVAALGKYQVTLAGGSTAHYQILLAEQNKSPGKLILPALRIIGGGGAAKPTALFNEVKAKLGVTIIHGYGMTEAPISSFNSVRNSDEQLANTDGLILDGLQMRIVATDPSTGEERDVPCGEEGEIRLMGANVMQGYLIAEQNLEAFDDRGFFKTGDLGRLRRDGCLCVTGRLKEIIIRKGENVSAREVEELLAKHPAVKDAAVIGLPDEERGELVCAVVELVSPEAQLTLEEVAAFLAAQKLMRQKIPERLEIMAEMPRNQSFHKVQKKELIRLFS